jgi:hypothetical protein
MGCESMLTDFDFRAFGGRRVQILRVSPALILRLLLDLHDRELSLTDGGESLLGAKVVACQHGTDDGLVWLYLESERFPNVPDGDVPYYTYQGIRDGRLGTVRNNETF